MVYDWLSCIKLTSTPGRSGGYSYGRLQKLREPSLSMVFINCCRVRFWQPNADIQVAACGRICWCFALMAANEP